MMTFNIVLLPVKCRSVSAEREVISKEYRINSGKREFGEIINTPVYKNIPITPLNASMATWSRFKF